MKETLLYSINNVEFAYATNSFRLENINFKVRKKEFITIIGPNGSGKSTLLKLLSGAIKPVKGEIMLKGEDISEYSKKELARVIAIVTQFNTIIYPLNVYEFVSLGRSPHLSYLGYESKKDKRIILESIEKVGLTSKIKSPVTEISGGEFQRALIARALTQEPEIILLDEATAHLDIKHQIEIFKLLEELNLEGMTIIFVSHNLNLPALHSRRFILMSEGKIFKDGATKDALSGENLRKVFGVDFLINQEGDYSGILIKK